ncbi:unnamed protein product [Acanthosepion pharaonis]|uniref:Uncharacterized protein n=1 Tax=Acanthosepion pharaonis TaxID=158019 RepID=A0A812AY59_ACAPH|nr:unnamed protein product [Sepia pharaonis]
MLHTISIPSLLHTISFSIILFLYHSLSHSNFLTQTYFLYIRTNNAPFIRQTLKPNLSLFLSFNAFLNCFYFRHCFLHSYFPFYFLLSFYYSSSYFPLLFPYCLRDFLSFFQHFIRLSFFTFLPSFLPSLSSSLPPSFPRSLPAFPRSLVPCLPASFVPFFYYQPMLNLGIFHDVASSLYCSASPRILLSITLSLSRFILAFSWPRAISLGHTKTPLTNTV